MTAFDASNPLVEMKITSAVCSSIAIASTICRLYRRRHRLWADDAWVLVAFVALLIQIVAVFLHVPMPNHLPRKEGVAVYYLMAATFYIIIWSSRLSILFSLVRLDPDQRRRRRLTWIAVPFTGAIVFFLAQLLWTCEPEPSWKKAPNPQCKLPLQVALCQLITDVIADAILLVAPIPLFRCLSDRPLRRKLTIIFSTCVVTTIVSLVHAAFILRNGGVKVVISALVEDCMSLVVANLPVVVTAFVNMDQADTQDHITTTTATLHFNTLPRFAINPSTTMRDTAVDLPQAEIGLAGHARGDKATKKTNSISWEPALRREDKANSTFSETVHPETS
ncbi:unnamed protein product [Mycena citricolor]|uniref:Rhodopsin domain-containing protein n=1 Tax=Mycena citricolor TaxID=2018698 RepID=A0AAD2H4L1_9AGAR|nr:unnamed protein product [Mycena citricolor]CAK5273635.1 unnamed protein product [Mycena citricolor]CAK5273649.1 unnamed protein product [Mycena citricolor]